MSYRMTLRRVVPMGLIDASVDQQIAALGFLTFPILGEVVAGRNPDRVQLCLIPGDPEGERTSRVHATFRFDSELGTATVADMGSTNGTYINGARLTGEHPIRHGDQVSLGLARFVVEIVDLNSTLGHTMTGGTIEMNRHQTGDESVSVIDIPEGGEDASQSMIG